MGQPIRIRFKYIKHEVLECIKEGGQLGACEKFNVSLIALRNWLARPDMVGDENYGGIYTNARSLGSSLWAMQLAYHSAHDKRISLMKRKAMLEREIKELEKEIRSWEWKLTKQPELEPCEVTE